MRLSNLLLITIITNLLSSGIVLASYFDDFIDPKDGKFDASQWLSSQSGFLPVPLIISDPAVGYGGGLAVAFMHDPEEDVTEAEDDPNSMLHLPPSVSFGAGAYTENESWMLAGGHIASWKEDTIRYTGAGGYGDFNLKFYGVESGSNPNDNAFSFNITGFFLLQEMIYRIKQSNVFAGARFSYLTSDVKFKLFEDIPEIDDQTIDSNTGGLGLIVKFDNRDNIMSPNSGHHIKFEPMFYNEAFGGDFNYTKVKLASFSYFPLSKFVIGVRLEGDFSDGDVPFYDSPFIDLRGIPAMRYQGEEVVVGELDVRFDITPRWSLTGFVGSGWTADSVSELGDQSGEVAGGAGVRYLMARRYGLRVGFDVAVGPEDTVVYLGVGSAW